jgi:hypothetical protein
MEKTVAYICQVLDAVYPTLRREMYDMRRQ